MLVSSTMHCCYFALAVLSCCVVHCVTSAQPSVDQSLFDASPNVVDVSDGSQVLRRMVGSNVQLGESGVRCPAMLIYYDSTCGHCRTMAPRLTKLSDEFAADPETNWMLMGAVNCAVHQSECNVRNVTDVPTLFFLSNGQDREGWSSPLPPTSDITQISRDVRQRLAAASTKLTAAEKDSCGAAKRLYFAEKARSSAAAHSNGSKKRNFSEERSFHPQDVAASVFYTLYHEVPMVPLNVEKRRPLLKFLKLLDATLPGLSLHAVISSVSAHDDHEGIPWTAAEWQGIVLSAGIPFEREVTAADSPVQPVWRTCRGSSWKFRGFTCGLWLTYHTLVANLASDDAAFDALQIIRAYALQFFACYDCRLHFSTFKWTRTQDHQHGWSPLVQLWAAHNQVNHRLSRSRDGSDPEVPKRLFPDAPLCSSCLKDATAVSSSVRPSVLDQDVQTDHIRFLSRVYHIESVSKFLTAWYRWRAQELPTVAAAQGSTIPPCPEDGDTCPLPAHDLNPMADTKAPSVAVGFSKTRHPDFVVRRDPMLIHVVLTVIMIAAAGGAGYVLVTKRANGQDSWMLPQIFAPDRLMASFVQNASRATGQLPRRRGGMSSHNAV